MGVRNPFFENQSVSEFENIFETVLENQNGTEFENSPEQTLENEFETNSEHILEKREPESENISEHILENQFYKKQSGYKLENLFGKILYPLPIFLRTFPLFLSYGFFQI